METSSLMPTSSSTHNSHQILHLTVATISWSDIRKADIKNQNTQNFKRVCQHSRMLASHFRRKPPWRSFCLCGGELTDLDDSLSFLLSLHPIKPRVRVLIRTRPAELQKIDPELHKADSLSVDKLCIQLSFTDTTKIAHLITKDHRREEGKRASGHHLWYACRRGSARS